MKYLKYGLIVIILIFLVYALNIYLSPPLSPLDKVTYNSEDIVLEVEYSRPYKKGRLIFGLKSDDALVPYNEYWRTGANYSTDFSVNREIDFGGTKLPKGKYWLYTIPNENSWKVILNEDHGSFGFFNPDKSKDILEIEVPTTILENSLEQFTIDFVEKESVLYLRLRWETTEISVPIK